MFAQPKAHCPVKSNGFLGGTAGRVQGGSPAASCKISGSFNQPPPDPAPSERAGHVKTVNDHTVFVQLRQQHDLSDDRIGLKRAEGDISA